MSSCDPHSNHVLTSHTILATFKALHECCCKDENCLELYNTNQTQGHYKCSKVKCNICQLDVYVGVDLLKPGVSCREKTKENCRFSFAGCCVVLDFNIQGPPDSFDEVHRDVIHQSCSKRIDKKLEQHRQLSREAFAGCCVVLDFNIHFNNTSTKYTSS